MSNEEETMTMLNEPLTFTKLTEITGDPIDAMRVAADLYTLSAYRATRALNVAAGRTLPVEPKPTSAFVRKVRAALKAKFDAIAEAFDDSEIERLKAVGPAVSTAIDRNDPELSEQIMRLVCMEPVDSAAWIREHLDEIEARFAS